MQDDTELLALYARDHSETAFAELVQRRINLVYSAALREAAGNFAAAEDITQGVFAELARKAPGLCGHPALSGWLYTSVRHIAANLRRSEQRRQRREQQSLIMNEPPAPDPEASSWSELRPFIDDAMHELSETDRAAVVLRFFEERSLKEVGASLGVNENAARMRVDRALERLRGALGRRGVVSTSGGLAAALAAGAVSAAPSALAGTVASAAVASAAAAGAATTLAFLKIMSISKLKTGAIAALVVVAAGIPAWQENRIQKLAAENTEFRAKAGEAEALRKEVAALKLSSARPEESAELRELKSEVLQLRSQAGAARSPAPAQAAASRLPGIDPADTNQLGGAFTEMMRDAIEQQINGRLARIKEKLNLSPGQSAAMEGIMKEQMELSSKFATKMFSGRMTKEEFAEVSQTPRNYEAEIQALLSPEQKAAYAEFKKEEAVSNARLAANAEMLQMQTSLGLTQDQQDKVYAALYEQTYSRLNGAGDPAGSSDPQEVIVQAVEQKTKALEGILTPKQMESYRAFQEQQLKFIKSMAAAARDTP